MVYLDSAATTALDAEVLDAILPYFRDQYGNASSVHTFGREARMAIERSRQIVADVLGAQAKEIIFTSSASEANNLAIKGVIEGIRDRFFVNGQSDQSSINNTGLEIISSPIEHPCVMESLKHLEKIGWAKIVWLSVNQFGMINPVDLERTISDNTVLITMMYVNNEIGTVMPIKEVYSVVKKVRKAREKLDGQLPIYLHTDAVQAIQYLDCDVQSLSVDFLSLTGHKFGGPKGSGLLYARNGLPLTRQIDGGGQEYYKRAGTENVASAVGLATALNKNVWRESSEVSQKLNSISKLQKYLISEVFERIGKSHLSGDPVNRAPHITSFIFENVDPEALIISLDREGYAVSSGSACSSGVVRQSDVIEALNLDIPKKSAALRVSTDYKTTFEEIEGFLNSLVKNVRLLREMSI